MDWDYYGVQDQTGGQPQYVRGAQAPGRATRERKELPKELLLHPWRKNPIPEVMVLLDSQQWVKQYSCENCQKRHEPPLCVCPNCEGSHLISR